MASEKSFELLLDLLTKPPQPGGMMAFGVTGTKPTKRIIDDDNVVGMGISEKISKRKRTGKLALTFYVERKLPLNKLPPHQVIPTTMPDPVSGANEVPTDVVVLGKLRPQVKAIRKPIQPGFSIGHKDISAGTLGAIVTKGKDLHILSNSHVLALGGLAKKGDSVVYPGPKDGGAMPTDLIAELSGFQKFVTGGDFVNRVDCAIAKPTTARLADLVSEIKGVGLPKGTIKAERGMKVVKVGRTSGKTTGEVKDVHFRFVLDFEGDIGKVGFVDQVLCTRYTEGGDSGSLVIDQATGRAVGLHFAGASGGSVFNPIDEVLKALGVKLVTKIIGAVGALPTATKKPAKQAAGKASKKAAGKTSKKLPAKSSKKSTTGGKAKKKR